MNLVECPMIFQVEITSVCNLRCTMCPYPMMTRERRHMTDREFDIIAGYLVPGQKVGLHVMGEPTLHPGLVGFITRLRMIDVKAEFATNGTLMNETLAFALIASGLHEIWFSIDSVNPIEYERIRGAKLLEVMYNTLGFLLLNREYADPIKAVVQKVGPLTSPEDGDRFLKMFEGWDARIKFLDSWAGTMNLDQVPVPTEERYPCAEPWNRVAVLVDGSVVPCCRDWEPKYVYGNIYEDTLPDIWHGEKATALREDMLSGEYSIEPCASCREWMIPMDREVVDK